MVDDPEGHFQAKLETKLRSMGVWCRFIEKSASTVHTADAAAVTGRMLLELRSDDVIRMNNAKVHRISAPLKDIK